MSDFVQTAEHGATKKMGPLPVWGWGALLGLAIVGVMWYRARAGGAPSSATGGDTLGTTDPNTFDDNALFTGNDRNAANATYGSTSMQKQVRTNTQWLRQAVQYETGKGRNGLVAMRALTRYLQGQSLTENQDKIVSDVLKNVGIPPKPPKTVSKVRHPTDPTPPTKPTHRVTTRDATVTPHSGRHAVSRFTTVSAVAGDSLASISQQVYGSTTPYHLDRIRRANGIGTTDEFVPGQEVRVPL